MSHTVYLRQLQRVGVSVTYACSRCRSFHSVRQLYFCADCLLLLCPCCTDAHIDGLFCPSCLTSVFSSSAQSNLGRCEQCVECPLCAHTLQTAYHSSTQLYSLVCPACRWQSFDRRQPHHPASLAAADVTQLLAAVRARETDDATRSEQQRITAQLKQRFKAVQQDKKQDRQGTASGAFPLMPSTSAASSSSSLTSTSLFASAAVLYRPATETSGLQRFLALEELVEKQRRAILQHQPFPPSSSAASSSASFPPVPPPFKSHFPERPVEPKPGEEKKGSEEGERVYGPYDSQLLARPRVASTAGQAEP